MTNLVVSVAVGLGVSLVLNVGVLDVLWRRDGMGTLLAISLGVNGALVTWLVLQSMTTVDESERLIDR